MGDSAEVPWKESPGAWRTVPRPQGWKALRAAVLARDDHTCTWVEDGQRCRSEGTDADHIGDADDHRPENLRTLCGPHHRKRTALQAVAARGPAPSRTRPRPAHPGLVEELLTPREQAIKEVRGDAPPF